MALLHSGSKWRLFPPSPSTDREVPLGRALSTQGRAGFKLQAPSGTRLSLFPLLHVRVRPHITRLHILPPPSIPSSCGLSAGLHQACLLPVLVYMSSGPPSSPISHRASGTGCVSTRWPSRIPGSCPQSGPLGGIFPAGSCLDIGRCWSI